MANVRRRCWAMVSTICLVSACGDGPSPTSPAVARQGLVFLDSSPPSGSTVVVEGCDGRCTETVALVFAATVESPLPAGASLLVELLNAGGEPCAFDFTESANLVPGRPNVFASRFLSLNGACPLPFSTSEVRATLIGDQMGRPSYLEGAFPLSYKFVVPPPASKTLTTPRILNFDWDAEGPTGYHACPLPDETVSVWCDVLDEDGDALTLRLRLENLGPGSISGEGEVSESYPPSPYQRHINVTFVLREATDVRATCEAVDSRGARDKVSVLVPCH